MALCIITFAENAGVKASRYTVDLAIFHARRLYNNADSNFLFILQGMLNFWITTLRSINYTYVFTYREVELYQSV